MKTLYKYLTETLNFGDRLFADNKLGKSDCYIPFLKNFKKYYKSSEYEKNTEEEQELLDTIIGRVLCYDDEEQMAKFGSYSVHIGGKNFDENDFRELVKLKKKFPSILDPSKAMKGGHIYRGMWMPVEDFLKIAPNVKSKWSNDFGFGYLLRYADLKKPIEIPLAKNRKDGSTIHSFTTDVMTASQFCDNLVEDASVDQFIDELVPCVISCKPKQDQVLFNPDFLDDIGGNLEEKEVLYMGESILVDKIGINDSWGFLCCDILDNENENACRPELAEVFRKIDQDCKLYKRI